MPQAAVQDADEPVGEGAEGLVVGRAVVTLPVVKRPGGRTIARSPATVRSQSTSRSPPAPISR